MCCVANVWYGFCTPVCVCMCVCTYVCMYVCVYVWVYVCVYVYVYVCVYVCVYVSIWQLTLSVEESRAHGLSFAFELASCRVLQVSEITEKRGDVLKTQSNVGVVGQ